MQTQAPQRVRRSFNDKIDDRILHVLQKDGRISNLQLAEQVHLSPSAVFERVKRLQREGYILGYQARLSHEKLGMEVIAFVEVQLERMNPEVMQRFDSDPMEAVAWMDRASATDYAALAPMVMRHADQGDPAGRRIVQSAAEQIDTLVRVLFEKGAPRVTLLGGLASPLEPWLSPDVRRRLKPADGDAVSGAIILAKRSLCTR